MPRARRAFEKPINNSTHARMHIRDQKEKGQMNGAERMSGKVVVPLGCHRGNGNRRCFGGRRRAVTALLSGKERCWSVVPVDREGSKTELRSENLSPPLDAMETIGAAQMLPALFAWTEPKRQPAWRGLTTDIPAEPRRVRRGAASARSRSARQEDPCRRGARW